MEDYEKYEFNKSRADSDPIDIDIVPEPFYKNEIQKLANRLDESNNYASMLESELEKVNSKRIFLEEQLDDHEIDKIIANPLQTSNIHNSSSYVINESIDRIRLQNLSKLENADAIIQALEQDKSDLQEKIEQLANEKSSLESHLVIIENKLDRTEENLVQKENKNEALKQELEEVKSGQAETASILTGTNRQDFIEEMVLDYEEKISELHDRLEEFEDLGNFNPIASSTPYRSKNKRGNVSFAEEISFKVMNVSCQTENMDSDPQNQQKPHKPQKTVATPDCPQLSAIANQINQIKSKLTTFDHGLLEKQLHEAQEERKRATSKLQKQRILLSQRNSKLQIAILEQKKYSDTSKKLVEQNERICGRLKLAETKWRDSEKKCVRLAVALKSLIKTAGKTVEKGREKDFRCKIDVK